MVDVCDRKRLCSRIARFLVLLQLRTYAAAGTPRSLAWTFVVLDFMVIASLIAMAIWTLKNPFSGGFEDELSRLYRSSSGNPVGFHLGAYDPYVWFGLVPLELLTLLVNVRLGWSAFCQRKEAGHGTPELMKIILRDNILYVTG